MRKFCSSLVILCLLVASLPQALLLAGTGTIETHRGIPRFTLDQAILTALQRNPDIQRARQEIERTKGLYLELRSEFFPRIDATGFYQNTDPQLGTVSSDGGGLSAVPGQYTISITATQVVFAGGRIISQTRSADFQRDAAYFAFRNAIDAVIASVRTQFYQVLLNRALIGVQEESVRLLESQLGDQQNRFEAGTVPRFNVLQAQVALSNQIPQLIAARNNYRIAQLQLGRTLGLDFDPNRGNAAPFETIGELRYVPRDMPLALAVEIAKERRPFLQEQKANVLSSAAQVGVARSGFFPQLNATISEDIRSSPFSENIRDVRNGYVAGATGSWAIWDWGQTYGRVKQAKAVLEQSKITFDDAVRQIEVEVQTAYSTLVQARELIRATEQTVNEAEEALRLSSARLSAGAGTQLEVLDARVQLTTAQSTRLQALYTYNAAVAEFDRSTASEVHYANQLDDPGTRKSVSSEARPTPAPKPSPLPLNRAGVRQPVSTTTTTTTTTHRTRQSGGK